MNRDAVIAIALGVVVVAVLAVVGLGAFGTTVTTSSSGGWAPFPELPRDGSSGVITDLLKDDGQSILGIPLSGDDYYAHVSMVAPESCILDDAEGRQVLSIEGECAGLPARGEVIGTGTTINGDFLVNVRIEIARDCFDALGIGGDWPPAVEACDSQ